MRMAPNQFVADCFDNIFKVEGVPFLGHLRVHDNMKEQIAKLFAQIRVVRFLDCFDRLVTFLDESGAQALMGLLAIPGTAARSRAVGRRFPLIGRRRPRQTRQSELLVPLNSLTSSEELRET